MGETDSFIDEVTSELRRERLYALARRYGWIPVTAIVLLVGSAAYLEWRNAHQVARARTLGDAIATALEADDAAARVQELESISTASSEGNTLLTLLIANQKAEAGDDAGALAQYHAISGQTEGPAIYRQVAMFRAVLTDRLATPEERITQLEVLMQPGSPLRLLAEEQVALEELAMGDRKAALARLETLLSDAEVTPGLRDRTVGLVSALGGTLGSPDMPPSVSSPAR